MLGVLLAVCCGHSKASMEGHLVQPPISTRSVTFPCERVDLVNASFVKACLSVVTSQLELEPGCLVGVLKARKRPCAADAVWGLEEYVPSNYLDWPTRWTTLHDWNLSPPPAPLTSVKCDLQGRFVVLGEGLESPSRCK